MENGEDRAMASPRGHLGSQAQAELELQGVGLGPGSQ